MNTGLQAGDIIRYDTPDSSFGHASGDNEVPEEFMRCMRDPVYFISNYCKLQNGLEQTPIRLRDYQIELIRLICGRHGTRKDNQTKIIKNHGKELQEETRRHRGGAV